MRKPNRLVTTALGLALFWGLATTCFAEWTNEDTEAYWTGIAEKATQLTIEPRMEGADAQAGEGMLEAFGTKYMPNAYAFYQEKRESAIEKSQLLKENFPNGRDSDDTGGALYDKISKACSKSVAEYFRRRDELCHFYLRHKAGLISETELAEIDNAKICIMLPFAGELASYGQAAPTPTEVERTFATKYLPETIGAYDRLANQYEDGMKLSAALYSDAVKLDAVRANVTLVPLAYRLAALCGTLDKLVKSIESDRLLHAAEEESSEELAQSDEECLAKMQNYERSIQLPDGLKDYDGWNEDSWLYFASFVVPIHFLSRNMLPIPGRNFKMQRTEVTQALWEAVMGNNPSGHKGVNLPVENVSWDDCQEFIGKLNALTGLKYRLPTEEEWEYACRAGGTGDYCRLKDGTTVTEETLGRVAWYDHNSGDNTHPVGQKEPNAFGLYDMHGNVWERTSTADGDPCWCCGGGYRDDAEICTCDIRDAGYPDFGRNDLGFRLAVSVGQ